MTKQVEQQFGNYRALYLLGQGALANVYLGSHIYLERRVAIKILRMRLSDEKIERFRREAQTVAQLEHPHIVQILDFGVQAGVPFLVMNYLPNGTLRQRHPRGSRVPIQTVQGYVQQIASALQYAHEQHVIHRDLKPENLLIGTRQEIVLSDFGIAIIAQNSLSLHIEEMAGTISYMAPEQIEGRPRLSSDQYALAALVYEWLSGVRPFEGSFVEIAARKSSQPAPPLRERAPQISQEIEQVVMKALTREPQERFNSIGAFADALRQAGYASASQSQSAHHLFPASFAGVPPTPLPSRGEPRESGIRPSVVQPATTVTPVLPIMEPVRGQEMPVPMVSGERGTGIESEATRVSGRPISPRIKRRNLVLAGMGLAALGVGGVAFAWLNHTATSPSSGVSSHRRENAVTNLHPTDYSVFGFDSQHTHFNTFEQMLSPDTVPHLVSYWVATTGTTITSSPAVVNNIVYIGCDDDKLYAFNAHNGALLWTFTTGNRVYSSPAVANGIVYFGSSDGNFYALDASTGKTRWIFPTSNQINSSPMVVNGVVYFGGFDTKVYALNAASGSPIWATATDAYIVSSPAVARSVLYIGSGGGQLYAFNASTGIPIWSTHIGDRVDSSPAVVEDIVYVGSSDTQLYALQASTGKVFWTAPAGEALTSSPAVAQGVVYIGSPDTHLYAFNATTGKPIWSTATPNQIYGSPTVANGVVYAGSWDFNLYAFDAASGKILWTAPAGDHVLSSVAVVNGALYFASWDSKVYAYHLPL